MRCQRVRSFLSAYCKGELTEKRSGAIAVHLEDCPGCCDEETAYREMYKSVGQLSCCPVSDDFNSQLLKRVADERFKETRTKAYIPKKIPVVTFNRLAPVFAAACFIFAFIFSGGTELFINSSEGPEYTATELNESYKDILPEKDHILNPKPGSEWAFSKEVARATRINGLMNQMASQNSFGSLASSRQNNYQSSFRVRQFPPMIRTYQYLQSNSNKGVNSSR